MSTVNLGWERFRERMVVREAEKDPVWVGGTISDVHWVGHRLCWTANGVKLRPLAAFNVDTFVDVPGDVLMAATTDDKGNYRTVNTAPGVGDSHRARCVRLPDSITAAVPLTVRETFYFHGTWGVQTFQNQPVQWPPQGVELLPGVGPKVPATDPVE